MVVAGAVVVGGSMLSNRSANKAAGQAANAQNAADARAIAEQQRQFDALQALMKPYVQASAGTAQTGGEFDAEAYMQQYKPDLRITGGKWGLGDGMIDGITAGILGRAGFEMTPEQHYEKYGKAQGFARPTKPIVAGQKGSLQLQQDLIGLNGNAAQQAAYDQIQNSAGFKSQLQLGQNAMLQNAAATGGLRGGNTQAAMAQFAPALLNQAIASQYQNLAGMTALGQNAAAMQGNAGMNSASQISNLYQSQGANTAGYQLARGQNTQNMIGSIAGAFGGMGGGGVDFGNLGKYMGVSF